MHMCMCESYASSADSRAKGGLRWEAAQISGSASWMAVVDGPLKAHITASDRRAMAAVEVPPTSGTSAPHLDPPFLHTTGKSAQRTFGDALPTNRQVAIRDLFEFSGRWSTTVRISEERCEPISVVLPHSSMPMATPPAILYLPRGHQVQPSASC